MISHIGKNCSGCHACVSICKNNCIHMHTDSEGFWYPVIDASACVNCNMCKSVCPRLIFDKNLYVGDTNAYAVINNNTDVRKKSASGGVFTLLAENIIDKGGTVFGAVLSDDCRKVYHLGVNTKDQLVKIQGSKYVQSKIGNSYTQAKTILDDGKPVLFTGTPCQIDGLLSFLKKEYPNLYTQDIICHGVPSPKVFRLYVDMMERKFKDAPTDVFFRSKFIGWKQYGMHIKFHHKNEYKKIASEDLYMRGFLFNLFLRPSCYTCQSKGIHHPSDITLADFWGCENVVPQLDDNLGLSLVLTHTEKGQRLLDEISDKITHTSVDMTAAFEKQANGLVPAKLNEKREAFFDALDKKRPEAVFKKFCDHKPFVKIKRAVKKLISK